MRLTEFWARMEERFGPAYAASVAHDQALPVLGGRSAEQALAAGVDAKKVWHAVCEAYEVPPAER